MRKTFFLAALLGMATVAEARDGQGRDQAIQTGRQLAMTLRSLSNDAQDIAQRQNQTGRGNPQLWQRIARISGNLAPDVRMQVVQPLRRGASMREANRAFQSLENKFDRLYYMTSQTRRSPPHVSNNIRQAKNLQFDLKGMLRRGSGGGGRGRYVAQCEVVLETAWGSDIRKFYASATATTKHQALSYARQDAMQQCQPNRRGLMKCTVNTGNCYAVPAGGGGGRGGRGGHGGHGGSGGR